MEKFRLPRKTKKTLRKIHWLYPPDEKGNSLMASPYRDQEDYDAMKKGIVKDLMDDGSTRAERKEKWKQLEKEIFVSDEVLKSYIGDIIREDSRNRAFDILIRAKNAPRAISAYYEFINAYHLYQAGEDSFGSICCAAIDRAKYLLTKKQGRIRKILPF